MKRVKAREKETSRTASQLFVFVLAVFVLFFAFATRAETTNGLSNAEIQGRKLAKELCGSRPNEGVTNRGVLQIRRSDGGWAEIPIRFEISVTPSGWRAVYRAQMTNTTAGATSSRDYFSELKIVHSDNEPSHYFVSNGNTPNSIAKGFHSVSGNELLKPFATSDFWRCDLGLQFFHWPEQKVLPNPTHLKRGRSYTFLESTNPNPSPNGYSRVLSWIDKETGGILEAEAFDAKGKLLKVFEPKSFEKVDGQWELQEMEIRNVQTDSRTRIKFDLKKN